MLPESKLKFTTKVIHNCRKKNKLGAFVGTRSITDLHENRIKDEIIPLT
jgi:hypothetical protein